MLLLFWVLLESSSVGIRFSCWPTLLPEGEKPMEDWSRMMVIGVNVFSVTKLIFESFLLLKSKLF